MGTFSVAVEIGDPAATRFESLPALVDTRASYTTLPAEMLGRLRVVPSERRQFQLADDTIVERDVGLTQVRIKGRVMPTLVVFEPVGMVALLGAYTLEGFGLGVDPVGRRLVPVRGLLMACTEVSQPMQAKRMSNGGPTIPLSSSLHNNFYENWLPEELVQSGLQDVRALVAKLEPFLR